MPRPTRMRPLRAPSLSAIWFSFIVLPSAPGPGGASALLLFDAHQVLHLVDHAAHRRSVLEDGAAVALVQSKALQCVALVDRAADRAAGLGDLDRLLVAHRSFSSDGRLGRLLAAVA